MKRHALFVGVNTYDDPSIQNLAFPTEDAAELASVFRRLLKFDLSEKLTNPAHRSEVVDAVKDMTCGLGPGDLFLFFFAGHGFRVKENHVLVCSKDEYADLEDEYEGLPVGQLKKHMRGPWNRMIVLDACQNDIRATRGADCGVASRDLQIIHAPEEHNSGSGFQIVVTACSEGQRALEVSDLGHGLFTSAFLDSVTSFAEARRRIDLEALRTDLGNRMGGLIDRYRLSGKQEPVFTMPANATGVVLFDAAQAIPALQSASAVYDKSESVHCSECMTMSNGQNGKEDNRFRKDTSYVVVHGYEQFFLINPSVKVFVDGEYFGAVRPYGTLMVPVEKNCKLSFKCLWRKANVHVCRGVNANIYLSFNRFSGMLNAHLEIKAD